MTKKQKEQKARAMHNYPACFYTAHEQRRASVSIWGMTSQQLRQRVIFRKHGKNLLTGSSDIDTIIPLSAACHKIGGNVTEM